MQSGEMDWWEVVDPDLNPLLRQARNLTLDRIDTGGTYAGLRFNHLHPPFDDPAARRALLSIVNQADFMQAVGGTNREMWRDGIGCFPAASPLASDVGLEALTRGRDLLATKAALAAAGKAAAKVVALHATDVSSQKALMSVGVDTLQQAGFDVDDATSDWGTLLQRRANRNPPAQGGWNALIVLLSGTELMTPAGHLLLRGNGRDAWFGWPDAPKLEALREQWFDAPDLEGQQRIGRAMQAQFFQDVPYIPLGQYFTDSGYQKGLTGIRRGMPLPLNVSRA
jgi:peptide/nickel transport system substrate-binding protein